MIHWKNHDTVAKILKLFQQCRKQICVAQSQLPCHCFSKMKQACNNIIYIDHLTLYTLFALLWCNTFYLAMYIYIYIFKIPTKLQPNLPHSFLRTIYMFGFINTKQKRYSGWQIINSRILLLSLTQFEVHQQIVVYHLGLVNVYFFLCFFKVVVVLIPLLQMR